mmetsp:Transcript_35991/g.94537  ORF Transcript_35991/g.94537 Transcript_35991/m.94537 type:complete len:151 (-) Transcript_35991:740-1192(-)
MGRLHSAAAAAAAVAVAVAVAVAAPRRRPVGGEPEGEGNSFGRGKRREVQSRAPRSAKERDGKDLKRGGGEREEKIERQVNMLERRRAEQTPVVHAKVRPAEDTVGGCHIDPLVREILARRATTTPAASDDGGLAVERAPTPLPGRGGHA